ncbi:exodeoxyribonuclease V subunit alpha [Kingella negevensis]|uniref:RecBCD enzyme subunit RecD n=1 Tax=Kingella negevensis TaxID=1522312 RepID=A0A238TBH6_9NEIS|nr:exodeoxyribonuclease V subunit alpha [Kingella negevensis]MDK4684239.1 exodeoxyribonuclease V subunit alpha [Kingella negevensis]MDK4698155.1 exodeoxyribonuclease V subunit alpha [Kingella negevensis]MDK4707216.1 exodeoxyribonuclease V subunit alpha [Kingella negevensis]MDK4710794.1 exodeoxyribonuclease V subunit alpha [Kingella negevensis]SNB70535.1 RecBCD enzyme subunit RecD [Kingella negevensis]
MPDKTHSPAHAAQTLFNQIAPEAASIAAPFVERLFAAFTNGDTFIYISPTDSETLAQAQPIVGNDSRSPIVLHKNQLFIARNWQLENDLAKQIKRLSTNNYITQPENHTKHLREWFKLSGSEDQQAAAALALQENFILISGGPGTGKTTTVAKLLGLLCQNKTLPHIALAAPTGKAAARLSEALQNAVHQIPNLPEATAEHLNALSGQTVHRLLGLKPPQMQPEYHAHNRLALDIVLIDEASMLDNHLLLQLLLALPDHCRVILLGDADQLPSVGAGAILAALSHSKPLQPENIAQLNALLPERTDWHTLAQQHAKLTLSHRFGSDSGIGNLARAVGTGNANAWQTFAQFPEELHTQPENSVKLVKQLYQAHKNYWQAIDSGDVAAAFAEQAKLMVLTALRDDAEQINTLYHQLLQQHRNIAPNEIWFAGQSIMIMRNAPNQNLYNGDIGIIMQPENSENLCAWFQNGDTWRSVPLSRLPECEPAFAITTHKSQGSEYEQVWFVAPTQAEFSRALLYTAITRAKKQFVYWGGESGFQAACGNTENRRSALKQFLA